MNRRRCPPAATGYPAGGGHTPKNIPSEAPFVQAIIASCFAALIAESWAITLISVSPEILRVIRYIDENCRTDNICSSVAMRATLLASVEVVVAILVNLYHLDQVR